jgi:hypothetical protein
VATAPAGEPLLLDKEEPAELLPAEDEAEPAELLPEDGEEDARRDG